MPKQPRNEIDVLESIENKIDKLIGVTAIQGKKEQVQAKILKSLGFKYREISELTGIPEGTLKTWDHQTKKRKK